MDNRKGEKLLSLWWVLVIIVIGGGIVIGNLMYYGADVDVRDIEANVLSEKIVGCLEKDGFLPDHFLANNFDIFTQCRLSKNGFDSSGEFYFKIKTSDENGKKIREDIVQGNSLFEKDCEISKSVGASNAQNYPRCITKKEKLFYFDKEQKAAYIEILSASNQFGKRIGDAKNE